jgi:hypothetical protein
MLPLLAAVVAIVPSKQPDSPSPDRITATAAVSISLSRAVRIDWAASGQVLVERTGPDGEERYVVEFE